MHVLYVYFLFFHRHILWRDCTDCILVVISVSVIQVALFCLLFVSVLFFLFLVIAL
jgi:hypothetical protein